jgi:hypothetical protein
MAKQKGRAKIQTHISDTKVHDLSMDFIFHYKGDRNKNIKVSKNGTCWQDTEISACVSGEPK